MDIREFTTALAMSYLGTPYRWGGDDPMEGFDCSGYMIELLAAVGVVPLGYDGTAQALYDRWPERRVDTPKKGCLVFFGVTADKITHVEYCLGRRLSIGASGGGSRTTTLADAIRQNAYVRVRPFVTRAPIGYVDPFLGFHPIPEEA